MRARWPEAFFAVSACSWMPHWACHFYRLETDSTFIVGSWSFTPLDSMIAIAVYSLLVAANVGAVIVPSARPAVGIISGSLHLCFAALHVARLFRPFPFEVIGHAWPTAASAARGRDRRPVRSRFDLRRRVGAQDYSASLSSRMNARACDRRGCFFSALDTDRS